MLTLANFNTTQAKTYYKRENYYSQEEDIANSEWRGHGASKYQLSGSIDDLNAYENIVNGLSPDGKTQLRQKQNHKDKKERAGVDLTFSAPKSVSIACLVGGDNRLEEAHRKALRRTIDLIEERYAFTRINDERVNTGNLIVAMWHHDTSRELDPHLHSHCLLMNCTQSPDGRWRTLSNEEFFRNKILLGQIYRNELALSCRKLGYEIESHPKELFEIKGYTREQIEAFSKRHEQIKEKLAEIGVAETTENKIWAWRKTRVKKNHEIDRQEMLPYWHSEADLYSITHPIANQNTQVAPTQKEVEAELIAAVQAGIEHCSERKVAFKSEDIEKFVTAQTKPFGISELRQAISSHPELITTFDGRYTTQQAFFRELATIELMQQGKGILNPITHPETIKGYLENQTLTIGQREAVKVAATTTDQFIAWLGVAGAGKTYALTELKQIATALNDIAPDYVIKGFAPSAAAAKVLEDELGIEANTVARLLVSKKSEQIQPNQIWLVDETGLLSAKAAHELLQRATDEQARVILVGDTRQLSAIEAGNPFKSLQQAGIQTAHLNESLRQKAPDLQKAVNLAAVGQITEAIAHLEQVGRIEEISDAEERTTRIATQYIKLPKEERQNTLILAGTHKERSSIINCIRAALKQEGTLGYGVETAKLKAVDLTSVQARYTHNYSVGDVVVPIREYRRLRLHKSQPYTVQAITGDKLTLSDLAGNQLTVDPMKFRKTVYKQEVFEVAIGDRLRWTRNDKELGYRNGQEFVVTGVEGQTANIHYLDGKTAQIELTQPLHCDYALVSTTYSSQGKTADRVLISSTSERTVSQESVYVAISRAKHDLQIFAEDRKFLFEQAQSSNAQETVLELLHQQTKALIPQQPVLEVVQGAELSPVTPVKPKLKRNVADEPVQQLAEALADEPVKAQTIDIEKEPVERKTGQLIETVANYVESTATEIALIQPLSTLLKGLRQLTEGVNQGQVLNQCLEALADSIEREAVELEILPALENLVGELSTLQTGKSLPLVSTSPRAELFEQATRSITNYIEQGAVESELTPVLENLTEQLKQFQPEISTPVDQLDTAISSCLQQILAVSALKQQEVRTHAVEAIVNYVEQDAVESTLNPQVLQTLTNELSQLGNSDLNSAMQQLEVTKEGYQVTDSKLILAEKAVQNYFAAEPPQPPSLAQQQAIQLEIDKLVDQINRLWSKQREQVKLTESMQKNPFHLWNKKYDAIVNQLKATMQAISQSLAQKDEKQSQQQQWSKQTKTYQEWEASPQTQAMRQLAAFLNLPQIQSRLRAILQEQHRYVASKQIQREGTEIAQAVKNMFRLTGTKIKPDGSLVLDGKNWMILQLGNTVSVTVKADNREILRVEGNKTTLFNPTPFERQKMHSLG